MKYTLVICLMLLFFNVFSQSIFFEDLQYLNAEEVISTAIIDSTENMHNENGQSHLTHFNARSNKVEFDDKIIFSNMVEYKDDGITGFVLTCYNKDLSELLWQYDLTGVGQTPLEDGKHYMLHDMDVNADRLELVVLFYEGFLFFDRPFIVPSISSIQTYVLDIDNGTLIETIDSNIDLIYKAQSAFSLKKSKDAYYYVAIDDDDLNIVKYSLDGEVLSSDVYSGQSDLSSQLQGITDSFAFRYGVVQEDDMEDSRFLSIVGHSNDHFIEKDVTNLVDSIHSLSLALLTDEYIGFYARDIYSVVGLDLVKDTQSDTYVFDKNAELLFRLSPTYLDKYYDNYVVDYHPILDAWLFIGTDRVPNSLDIHKINTNGQLELLYQLDIDQFDHLLFAEGINMLENGDIMIEASQTRYPHLKRSDKVFNFPIFLKITKEQLGLEVSTKEIVTEEQTPVSVFDIYPQPATEYIKLRWHQDFSMSGSLIYQISDMRGRLIQSGSLKSADNIDISKLVSGQYLLQLRTNTKDLGVQSFVKI